MRGAALILAAALAACTPTPPVEGVVIPPPATACAPVEPEPLAPALSEAQRLALDVAAIRALGEALAVNVIRYRDVSYPAWARRQAERVRQTRSALCEAAP